MRPRGRLSALVPAACALVTVACGAAAAGTPSAPRTAAAELAGSSPAPATPGATVAASTSAQSPVPRSPTSPAPRPFVWQVEGVTAAELGASWHPGCPVGPTLLRAVTTTYRDRTGQVRTGVLVLHRDVVDDARRAFARLYRLGFPLTSVRPVSDFGASDDDSMAADNTSAFNCRYAVAAGPKRWSRHAYGKAIDVNPVENPYLFGREVLPPAGAAYADRGRDRPGMLVRGGPELAAFLDAGFTWGGDFGNPDYQHVEHR